MRRKAAALALLLCIAAPSRAGTLDGTQWQIRPRSTFQRVVRSLFFWRSSVLSFAAGQVSKGKSQPIPYTAADENGKAVWKAEQTEAQGTKVVWTGTWDGDKMTGATTFTRGNGKTRTYEWTARKCEPKKDESGGSP
jgi:hypothetical protein